MLRHVLLLAVATAVALAVTPTSIIQTESGPVRGTVDRAAGVNTFKGIPFAAPPEGGYRFMPPQPVTPWNETLDCYNEPNFCPQLNDGPVVTGDEDCLYLNVYAPIGATPEKPVAVMVWIFGGGYVIGSLNQNGLYDGTALASQYDVIVVAMNYRLSVLGFLALDTLQGENPYNTTGNYALQDQIAAMQWVNKNIAKFGGDTTKVLLFGESAGAFSVCWHLVSPASAGLFTSAIMESGTCDAPQFFYPLSDAVEWGREYADAVKCSDPANQVECLRGLSLTEILNGHVLLMDRANAGQTVWKPALTPIMPWGPAIDGSSYGLLETPLTLLRGGKFNQVPTIMGVNKDEGTIFLPMFKYICNATVPFNNASTYLMLDHFFNTTTSHDIANLYPLYEYGNSYDTVAANVLRDYFFTCATRRALAALETYNVPRYFYHFTYEYADPIYLKLGDYHSSELEFVFGNAVEPDAIFTSNDKKMVAIFGQYWTNMAKYSNPNGAGSDTAPVVWPEYETSTLLDLVMNVPATVESDYDEGVCEFWDTVVQQYDSPPSLPLERCVASPCGMFDLPLRARRA